MSQATRADLPTIITTDTIGNDTDKKEVLSTAPDQEGAGHTRQSSLNNSISQTEAKGHTRKSSLQVPGSVVNPDVAPGSPSSPTLSATSDLSSSESTGRFKSALALRNNDPHQHVRQTSVASAFTDVSQDQYCKNQASKPSHSSEDGKGYTKYDQCHPDQTDNSQELDANGDDTSGWKKFMSHFKSQTRSGRRAAQARALEQERQRARQVDPAPFRIRPIELADLVDPKSVSLLHDFGGIDGLLSSLGTDGTNGLDLDITNQYEIGPQDDLEKASRVNYPEGFVFATREERERLYGRNVLPEKKSKSLLLLMWLALQDKILILLCIAAVVSLALGLYSDFGAPREMIACARPPPGFQKCPAPQVDWVEGVAILVAVAIVDIVGSLNDWQKERQFKKLNSKKEERNVKVIRRGNRALMSVHNVQVGDVLEIEPGEILPCDGVFLRGHNVKCDESGATGESDMIRKISYEECFNDWEQHETHGTKLPHRDCFLISGSRCLEGVGEYVVIAVGPSSFHGKLMMSLRTDSEMTPLQSKLNRLAEIIAYAGTTAGILLFAALMIRFFVQLAKPKEGSPRTPNQKAQNFINILISAVVIIVVAVPEGLPLATTLALAFATKRMTKENLLVRHLSACETSANGSVICTDKTGTLTQNEMSVVAGSIGVHLKFALDIEENSSRVESLGQDNNSNEDSVSKSKDWAIEQRQLNSVINGPLRQLFNEAIAANSTAFEESSQVKPKQELAKKPFYRRVLNLFSRKDKFDAESDSSSSGFVGSKTETALLKMAKELHWENYHSARTRNKAVTNFPFSSARKAMAVVVEKPEGGYRLHVKGASEVLTKLCSSHVQVKQSDPNSALQVCSFDTSGRENVAKTIIFYANQMLRTLAICYRDFESWPPECAQFDEDGLITYESLAKDLTLISVVGIEDPLRPGVRNAVSTCSEAGVQVKMCTGDNVLTARSIASQCGIFTPGGIIMEGPVFRTLKEQDMMVVVSRLQVLARCSPEDKKILVECLKKMDHVVSVTGDGTNDAPALKTANVGFSMGIAGTEVAREASDIILMDDNFESIVTAIMWGRSVNDAVKRFLQFQLSVNIGAVGITFISAVASDKEESIFTAVQLLWINLIMDTLAALALATDPASRDLLKRKPDKRNAPLLTTDMWKMIIGQSIYQFALILTFNFAGYKLLNLHSIDPVEMLHNETLLRSLIFNLYVWCQLFNQVNCRSLTRDLNFFKGLHRNMWFIGIILIEIGLQTLISFKGKDAFSIAPLGGREWAISIIGGIISWPVGLLIRLIPTKPIDELLIRLGLMPDPKALPRHRTEEDERENENEKLDWDQPAIGQLAEKLNTFARIRGGRSRVAFIGKTRSKRMKEADVHAGNLMALVPGLIGAGIVGNWKPTNPPEASRSSPASGDPSLSSWQLFEGGKIQIHPQTAPNDTFLDTISKKEYSARK